MTNHIIKRFSYWELTEWLSEIYTTVIVLSNGDTYIEEDKCCYRIDPKTFKRIN
jgi:hypothetical protein